VPATNGPPVVETIHDSSLIELQGRWDRQTAFGDPTTCADSIEINCDHLVARFVGKGKLETVCAGRLEVKHVGAYRVAVVFDLTLNVSDRRLSAASTWLYKAVGDRLTIAWNFDETCKSENPIVASYYRVESRFVGCGRMS
jgi:hypothetical protein